MPGAEYVSLLLLIASFLGLLLTPVLLALRTTGTSPEMDGTLLLLRLFEQQKVFYLQK